MHVLYIHAVVIIMPVYTGRCACTLASLHIYIYIYNVYSLSCRIPEFSELWRDLLKQPQTISPQLTGQLYCGHQLGARGREGREREGE